MISRHYAVWIDADSIVPTNSHYVDEAVKALKKDPACLILATGMEAYHASMLGLSVVRFHYYPLGGQFSAAPVLCVSVTEYIELVTPFPWTHSQAVSAARSSLNEAYRDNVIPLAPHGLI